MAFAGAYAWTVVPFCLGVGLLCAFERPAALRGPARVLDWCLAVSLAVVGVQLTPLPSSHLFFQILEAEAHFPAS
jgi:hypothetical protein